MVAFRGRYQRVASSLASANRIKITYAWSTKMVQRRSTSEGGEGFANVRLSKRLYWQLAFVARIERRSMRAILDEITKERLEQFVRRTGMPLPESPEEPG